ncbi:MAG: hypothetical protein GY925_29360, partial [Actinomycetia bacterium]|nr:hypothetical protein [Actinomycetes bacterium]
IHPIRTFRVAPGPDDNVESVVNRIGCFLPANFIALPDPTGDHALVAGFDHAGWTSTDYVLPRLASGGIFPTEPGDAENRYDIVLNLFHEGYQAMADDLDDEDFPSDAFEGRIDCVSFALTHFALLAQVDLGQAFRHGGDFYLTRNGHGAGFWDRRYGNVGTHLSKAAKIYGSTS